MSRLRYRMFVPSGERKLINSDNKTYWVIFTVKGMDILYSIQINKLLTRLALFYYLELNLIIVMPVQVGNDNIKNG